MAGAPQTCDLAFEGSLILHHERFNHPMTLEYATIWNRHLLFERSYLCVLSMICATNHKDPMQKNTHIRKTTKLNLFFTKTIQNFSLATKQCWRISFSMFYAYFMVTAQHFTIILVNFFHCLIQCVSQKIQQQSRLDLVKTNWDWWLTQNKIPQFHSLLLIIA